jgi:hypothetical protein
MGSSSFFNTPVAYDVIDEGGEGSSFFDGPAYTQIDPVAIQNMLDQATASAAASEVSRQAAHAEAIAAAASATSAATAVQAAAGTASPLMDGAAAVGTGTKWAHEDHRHPTDTSRAPIASPALTGTPTAPTPSAGDNSTKVATTAYADTALAQKAPLASPALTGTPTAPTAANGTNTTQLATTAFVLANGGGAPATVAPLMNGTAAVGTSLLYARQDHVHPSDTSRAALAAANAFTDTTQSTTTSTGALTTAGGLGVAKNLSLGGNIKTFQAATVAAQLDNSAATGVQVLNGANGAISPALFGNDMNLIYLGETQSLGKSSLWIAGGGFAPVLIAQAGTNYVVGSSPAAGFIGMAYDGVSGTYRMYNNLGATCTFRPFIFRAG